MEISDAERGLVDALLDTLDAYVEKHEIDLPDIMLSVIAFYCGVACLAALDASSTEFEADISDAWSSGVFNDILEDTMKICRETWEMRDSWDFDDDEDGEDLDEYEKNWQ